MVTADARAGIYVDSDHTTIITATGAASGTIKDRINNLGAIFGRHRDERLGEHGARRRRRGSKDTRHEGSGAVAYADGTRTGSLGYVFSTENDWTSHSINGGASHDFYDHQLTASLGGSVTFNAVGRSGDANFARDLTQGSVAVGATIVPSRNDLVNVTYTLMVLSGYQASRIGSSPLRRPPSRR